MNREWVESCNKVFCSSLWDFAFSNFSIGHQLFVWLATVAPHKINLPHTLPWHKLAVSWRMHKVGMTWGYRHLTKLFKWQKKIPEWALPDQQWPNNSKTCVNIKNIHEQRQSHKFRNNTDSEQTPKATSLAWAKFIIVHQCSVVDTESCSALTADNSLNGWTVSRAKVAQGCSG